MRVVVASIGALLVVVTVSEFFVVFLLPRRVRRNPRIAGRFDSFLWAGWRRFARRLGGTAADTWLGFFGPLAILMQLVIWAVGSIVGYSLIEWAVSGGPFSAGFFASSDLFFGEASFGTVGLRIVELLEVATGIGVLFIVIGYLPAVYSAFSAREAAISQLAARAGSPPAAAKLLRRTSRRGSWRHLEADLERWETWAAQVMETQLTFPPLAFYRSQHVNQNWLAALTAMVDVAAFLKATVPDDNNDTPDLTFRLGRQALADLAFQFGLEPVSVDRLSDAEFDELFEIVAAASVIPNLGRQKARRRLARYRAQYEGNAAALAEFLVLDLPPWCPSPEDTGQTPRAGIDLVGQTANNRPLWPRRSNRVRPAHPRREKHGRGTTEGGDSA
jgi:hypothetical protein